jgi:uncharacterized membrane protein (DUF4010 family)
VLQSSLPITRFPATEVAAKLAVAIGVGLLVGIEREWSNKDLGARTFALTALLGAVATMFGPSMAIASFVGIFIIVIFANARSVIVGRSLEATTSAALLAIFVLGALAGQGHLFTPVAAAILMTMLLAWKVELHRFAGGLQPEEIRSAVLLGLLGLVVYPILPDRFIDPWQLVNPRQAWVIVIVIAGIGFVNYVLLKVYGTRGIYVSGFLGGFVNSTAAAVELAKPLGAEANSSGIAVAALLLTIVAMFTRNLLILGLFAPSAVPTAALPLLSMALIAAFYVHRSRADGAGTGTVIQLQSPVSLWRVLNFALLFLAIQIVSALGERHLGKFGFLGISAMGGLVSSASTSAAAASMVGHGEMHAAIAGEGVVVASVASAIINLPIVFRNAGNRVVARRLATITVSLCLLGLALLVAEDYARVFRR